MSTLAADGAASAEAASSSASTQFKSAVMAPLNPHVVAYIEPEQRGEHLIMSGVSQLRRQFQGSKLSRALGAMARTVTEVLTPAEKRRTGTESSAPTFTAAEMQAVRDREMVWMIGQYKQMQADREEQTGRKGIAARARKDGIVDTSTVAARLEFVREFAPTLFSESVATEMGHAMREYREDTVKQWQRNMTAFDKNVSGARKPKPFRWKGGAGPSYGTVVQVDALLEAKAHHFYRAAIDAIDVQVASHLQKQVGVPRHLICSRVENSFLARASGASRDLLDEMAAKNQGVPMRQVDLLEAACAAAYDTNHIVQCEARIEEKGGFGTQVYNFSTHAGQSRHEKEATPVNGSDLQQPCVVKFELLCGVLLLLGHG